LRIGHNGEPIGTTSALSNGTIADSCNLPLTFDEDVRKKDFYIFGFSDFDP